MIRPATATQGGRQAAHTFCHCAATVARRLLSLQGLQFNLQALSVALFHIMQQLRAHVMQQKEIRVGNSTSDSSGTQLKNLQQLQISLI